MLLPLVLASLNLTAITIAGIGLATVLANFFISIGAAAIFALVVARLYRKHSGPGKLDARWVSPGPPEGRTAKRIPAKGLLAGAAAAFTLATVAATLIASNLETDEAPLVIAHRGASSKAPENTMAAIRGAIADRADFVEIDVQETADGEVVVFHDSDFMKTAANPLKIWEATHTELQKIDIGTSFDPAFANERVPTLDEVLSECKGRIKVMIELKYYGHDVALEQRVIDIVERHDMSKDVAIMSLKAGKVAKTRALRPNWTCGLLTSVQLGNISQFDVDFLAVNAARASRRFVHQSQKGGRDLYVWTVNDPLAMSSMMGRGVNGIITDKPALARRVREIRAGMNPFERFLITLGTEVGILSLPNKILKEQDA
jgi:glycerophosphoryl diester phosphodiesterase